VLAFNYIVEKTKESIYMIIVYGIKENLNPMKAKLSDAIHRAMHSVLGMPEDKRAHRFIPMDKADFYYPDGRSDNYTVIEINMMAGRKISTKKALIQCIFQELETSVKLLPIDVEITIKEQPAHCWGFRGITGDEVADLKYKVNV